MKKNRKLLLYEVTKLQHDIESKRNGGTIMTGDKTAVPHRWNNGADYKIYGIAYGKNPYGPQGSTCGVIDDGEFIYIEVEGHGPHPPFNSDWMQRACDELNNLPDGKYEIIHNYWASMDYEIIPMDEYERRKQNE